MVVTDILFEFAELRDDVFKAVEHAFVFHGIVALALSDIFDDLL
jgi:hypothetical protein